MHRLRFLWPAVLCTLIAMPVSVLADDVTADDVTTDDPMGFEDLFRPELDGTLAEDLEWRPGSHQLRLTWDGGDGEHYVLFDALSGEHQVLATPADLRGGDEALAESDIADLRFMPSGDGLLYAMEGDLYHFSLLDKTVQRLTASQGDEEMVEPSPDSRKLAYVRHNDLYMLDLEAFRQGRGGEQRLSEDGEPDVVFNGITDWVYWEEIWGRDATASWWNGEGSHLAYYHIDDREVSVYPLVDTSELHPKVTMQRYPKAGDALPKVEFRVVDVATKRTVRLDTGDDPDVYLARLHWHPDGKQLLVQRLNREQTQIDLLLCQASDGSCDLLMSEQWPTWINLGDEFTFLADGGFLWSSEKSGWKHLYLHDAQGRELRRLTPEGWSVTSLDHVDEANDRLVFTAYGTGTLGASERHVFTAPLSGGEARQLTSSVGWHSALVSASGDWVHTVSDADTPPLQMVRRLDDVTVHALPHIPPTDTIAALPRWRFFTLDGPEGSKLPAQIMLPTDLQPTRRYPVIMYHYGGPASQVVARRWRDDGLRGLWHKYLATRGYVLLAVDNQASSYFGKQGEDRLHRRFGDVELAGQLAAVDYLKTLPWVDSQRIGLWGWSGGGSHTLYSLLRRPGVWKAGISGAPVTAWGYYDAIWMERYLDHPADNVEGYETSSPLTHAANLQDALLLIHGTADDNVHAQNSLNLATAFIEAGVPFDLALYPGAKHSFSSFKESGRRHLIRRMTDFFDRHLMAEAPGTRGEDRSAPTDP